MTAASSSPRTCTPATATCTSTFRCCRTTATCCERADRVIDAVMAKVIELGGVVSGEHGIGITKLKYLDRQRIVELTAYRRDVDPLGTMNPGKLEDYAALDLIFTPSFNLLELEARILQHGQIEHLSRKIAHCVRCGKCKPDCCVNHPGRGMFYHPRNKNLAIGSLIEALLYEAQRERSTHFELLQWLDDVADHCTLCHKCLKPCPVDIDTGEVSVLEREILGSWGYKKTPLATRLTLRYLESRSPLLNKAFRTVVLQTGIRGSAPRVQVGRAAAALGRPFSALCACACCARRCPRVPAATLRDLAPPCEPDQALVFEPSNEAGDTVFYFPGCGSERLHSSISLAAIHILLETDTRVVLPPPFLCCGFPAHVNAKTAHAQPHGAARHDPLHPDPRHVRPPGLRRLRRHLRHVSRGAREHGGGAPVRRPDRRCRGLRAGTRATAGGRRGGHLYHAPCHDSLDGAAGHVLDGIGGFGQLTPVPHCCSEAGTLALSRPDITDDMLHRKREAMRACLDEGRVRRSCSPTARRASRAWRAIAAWATRPRTWPSRWRSGRRGHAGRKRPSPR